MPNGLSAFEFELEPVLKIVRAPPERGGSENFSAQLTRVPETCVAIVLRNDLI
jgi:hypothetical protein